MIFIFGLARNYSATSCNENADETESHDVGLTCEWVPPCPAIEMEWYLSTETSVSLWRNCNFSMMKLEFHHVETGVSLCKNELKLGGSPCQGKNKNRLLSRSIGCEEKPLSD